MSKRITKCIFEEPESFEDLSKRFVKDKSLTIPVYVVNKVSGLMHETFPATIEFRKICGEYCGIKIKNGRIFFIREEEKHMNNTTGITHGSFYSGNYELFLHQKDAAERSRRMLIDKRNRLDIEIAMLDDLCNN